MREQRPPKDTDQEQAETAYKLLNDCMRSHPEIEPNMWASACWSTLVNGYIASGVSYEEFTEEWDSLKHHYKPWFDNDK